MLRPRTKAQYQYVVEQAAGDSDDDADGPLKRPEETARLQYKVKRQCDWWKMTRNVGLAVAGVGFTGAVLGVAFGVVLTGVINGVVPVAGFSSAKASAAAVTVTATTALKGAGGGAALSAANATEAAAASAKLAADASSMAGSAQDASVKAAKAAVHAATAAMNTDAQLATAICASQWGLGSGMVLGVGVGLEASRGGLFSGRYCSYQTKIIAAEAGDNTPKVLTSGKLQKEFPHVWEQLNGVMREMKNASALETEQTAEQLMIFLDDGKRTVRPIQDQITTCLLTLHNMDDTFMEELLTKIDAELPEDHEPKHDETAFNVLRALRYWHSGKPLPAWVVF